MIKNSLRLLAACVCSAAVSHATAVQFSGKPAELVLLRTSGEEIQRIPLQSWIYDDKSTTLYADSSFGGYRCKSAPSLELAPQYLALDDGVYSLVSLDASKAAQGEIYATPVAMLDDFNACRPLVGNALAKGPSTDLTFDVIRNGTRANADVVVAGGLSIGLGTSATVSATIGAELICFDGNNSATGTLTIRDVNNLGQSFRGAQPRLLRFFQSTSNSLELDAATSLACFDMSAARVVQSQAATCPDLSNAQLVFGDGFESSASGEYNSFVATGIRIVEAPEATNDFLDYEVTVTNCKDVTLDNIALRGFADDNDVSLTSSQWGECASSTCAPEEFASMSEAGYLRASNDFASAGGLQRFSLAPGATKAFAVRRAAKKATGSIFVDAIAVVSPGSQPVPGYDAVTIDALANAQPTLSATGTTAYTLTEDTALPLVDILQAADLDSGFDCAGASCVSVTTDNPALLGSSDVAVDFDPASNLVSLTFAPRANRFGNVGVAVSVTDAGGARSQSVDFNLNVTNENDPPIFSVGRGWTPETRIARDMGTNSDFRVDGSGVLGDCNPSQTDPASDVITFSSGCMAQNWESYQEVAASGGALDDKTRIDFQKFIVNLTGGAFETDTIASVDCSVRLKNAPNKNATVCSTGIGVVEAIGLRQQTYGYSLEYRLSPDSREPVILSVTATDDGGLSTTAEIEISVENAAPVANDDSGYTTDQNTAVAEVAPGVLANDVDTDPLSAVAQTVSSAQGASASISADGSFNYDPSVSDALKALDDGDSVVDTFTYTVTDGILTDTGTVAVTVTGVNDAPVALTDTYENNGSSFTLGVNILTNDEDVDGDTLTVTEFSQGADIGTVGNGLGTDDGGTLQVNADGALTYVPNSNGSATQETFEYVVSDGDVTATGTIVINIARQ